MHSYTIYAYAIKCYSLFQHSFSIYYRWTDLEITIQIGLSFKHATLTRHAYTHLLMTWRRMESHYIRLENTSFYISSS